MPRAVCLSRWHNGQDLPLLVHTDWRLSEYAACLKEGRAYYLKAQRLKKKLVEEKRAQPLPLRGHLTFRDSSRERFRIIIFS